MNNIRKILERYLKEAGQAPGKLEVDKITLEEAREYAEKEFAENGRDLDTQLPDFDENFKTVQDLTRVGKTQRKDMPVIEDFQVKEFQKRLLSGSLDINKPFSGETDPNDPFPEGLTSSQADKFLKNGLRDGSDRDDVVSVSSVSVPASDLKPIQRQIYFDKSIGAIAEFGVGSTKEFLKSSLMIMSGDQYIIDGHHRWLSANLVDPDFEMTGIKIDLPIHKLLPLATAYGDALGNKRNERNSKVEKIIEIYLRSKTGWETYGNGEQMIKYLPGEGDKGFVDDLIVELGLEPKDGGWMSRQGDIFLNLDMDKGKYYVLVDLQRDGLMDVIDNILYGV